MLAPVSGPATARIAFATTHPGLEMILARELAELNLTPRVMEPGGVEFEGDERAVARANLGLRTASRITLRIAAFHAGSFHELERHGARVPWQQFLAPGVKAHLRVSTSKSKLYHERAIIERLTESVRSACPNVEMVMARGEADQDERSAVADLPIQRFVVRVHRDECVVSVDTSGPLLHRRGYRTDVAKAPLRETLAAGCLLAAGWDGSTPLVDPMCGSGTIPIEAALIARRIPPGLRRRFAFENWPLADPEIIRQARAMFEAEIRDRAPAPILGSDRDPGAIVAATANAVRAGVSGDIDWRRGALSTMDPPSGPGWVVTNPPYGHRIGDRAPLRNLYAQFGNVLRRQVPGWQVAMISADRMLEGQAALAWHEQARTDNGGIRVRLVVAEVPKS